MNFKLILSACLRPRIQNETYRREDYPRLGKFKIYQYTIYGRDIWIVYMDTITVLQQNNRGPVSTNGASVNLYPQFSSNIRKRTS